MNHAKLQRRMTLSEMNEAALGNLGADRMPAYIRYRDSLIADGESMEEIEQILRGYIWNEIEFDE